MGRSYALGIIAKSTFSGYELQAFHTRFNTIELFVVDTEVLDDVGCRKTVMQTAAISEVSSRFEGYEGIDHAVDVVQSELVAFKRLNWVGLSR